MVVVAVPVPVVVAVVVAVAVTQLPGILRYSLVQFAKSSSRPTRSAHGLDDVGPGAHDIVERGRLPCEARQEGSTYGECSTHTPP